MHVPLNYKSEREGSRGMEQHFLSLSM